MITRLGYARARSVGLGGERVADDPVPEVPGQDVGALAEELDAEVPAGEDEPLLEADRLQQLADELVGERVAVGIDEAPGNEDLFSQGNDQGCRFLVGERKLSHVRDLFLSARFYS